MLASIALFKCILPYKVRIRPSVRVSVCPCVCVPAPEPAPGQGAATFMSYNMTGADNVKCQWVRELAT